jgi:integrase/recombinase XerD
MVYADNKMTMRGVMPNAAITDLLSQGIPLEAVQYLAGQVKPRTMGLYDWRQKKVTRNIAERISI